MSDFIETATRYCAFLEGAGALTLRERLLGARDHLAALYLAACSLPEGDAADVEATGRGPISTPGADWGQFEQYWEVFDPYEQEEPVAGSLSDDLGDVYRDLKRGFAELEHAGEQAAIWSWRFHFEVHWGAHAIDALRALHRALARAG